MLLYAVARVLYAHMGYMQEFSLNWVIIKTRVTLSSHAPLAASSGEQYDLCVSETQ